MPTCHVAFSPLGKTVTVEAGVSLLEAAARADITMNNICGGDGICGRCKMIVRKGRVDGEIGPLLTREEVRRGVVLACRCSVQGDLQVEIPEETRARETVAAGRGAERFRAVHPGIRERELDKAPLVAKVFLKLPRPTLDDNLADCRRLQAGISKVLGVPAMQTGLKIMRRLSAILREGDFEVTATVGRRGEIAEIMDVEAGDSSARNVMAVIDVGTSTIVAQLVDALTAETMDSEACFNSQAIQGREITARIMASERNGEEALQAPLVEDLNRLISSIAVRNGVQLRDINAVVCSGNTAMMHFLLGLPARHIRRNPYVPVTVAPAPLRAAEVGLRINPRGLLFTVPGISGWVGGDLTAGIVGTGMHEADEISMLIDVGTNGEVIIGNKEWLIACSASAGPALEGASVACGMMAEDGAIEEVCVEDGAIRFRVIGDVPAVGLCGSGIIDLIAVLLGQGIIDRSGKFVDDGHRQVRWESGAGRFVLVEALGNGSSDRGVFITQEDIDNVVTAKAAIFAAAKIVLDRLELDIADVQQVLLAGGFGTHINRENAIRIGLLPDLPLSKIHYVGNTSIWGAKLAACSAEAYGQMRAVSEATTYYDLLGSPDYVEQFRQAMFLPHTNIELFPSLQTQTS